MLYAGGDYALYPNIMLLVQAMAYVMSGTLASDEVRHLTCAPESGPLIGSPIRTIRPGWECKVARESVEPELLTRAEVFVIWERNVDYVKCYM